MYHVLSEVKEKALEPRDEETLISGALTGITQSTADYPYTAWLPMEEKRSYENEIQGKLAGIGIQNLHREKDSKGFRFIPIYGTPAWSSGLQFGDLILQVNGEEVSGWTIDAMIEKLRGKRGEEVRLMIRPRQRKEVREVRVVRDLIQQEIVCGDRRKEDGSWDFRLEGHPEIGYIRISQFADRTVPDFDRAIEEIRKEGVTSLILDFRGNPGGFLPAAAALCDHFLDPSSVIVTTRHRDGSIKRRFLATHRKKTTIRLAVLIDDESASASEIVASALQDHHKATIVGTRSYGKGTVQELFPLPFQMGLLRLTDASFWRPSGISLHRFRGAKESDVWGVSPDPGSVVPVLSFQKVLMGYLRMIREALTPEERSNALKIAHEEMESLQKRILKSKTKKELRALELESGIPLINFASPEEGAAIPSSPEKDNSDRFKLVGSAPWFDPQLDQAIKVLSQPKQGKPQGVEDDAE